MIQSIKPGSSFLVIMDFSDAAHSALKYAIKLAKTVQGTIELFNVERADNVVNTTNQAAAIRDLHMAKLKTRKNLNDITDMILSEGVPANYKFELGNINTEIKREVSKSSPNVVVLGKPENRSYAYKQLVKYLLFKYKGLLLVVGEKSEFEKNSNITMSFDGKHINESSLELVKDLSKLTASSLTLVSVEDSKQKPNKNAKLKNFSKKWSDIKVDKYQSTSIEVGLDEYTAKMDSQLLCVGRNRIKTGWVRMLMEDPTDIVQILNNVKAPVLVVG